MSDRNTNMRAFHAQLSKLGLMEEKRAIIAGYTNGETDRASKLTDSELSGLVAHLNRYRPDPNSPKQRMIRSLYFHARQLGWFAPDGRGGTKVDTERLNNWCRKYTQAHSPLANMSDAELRQALTAIKRVVTTDTEKLAKIKR